MVKKKGILRATVRVAKGVNRAVDKAATRAATRKQPKNVRSAKAEYAGGERLPAPRPQPRSAEHYIEEDKERYRVLVSGTWVEVEVWPDERNIRAKGKEKAVELYGVYAMDWEVQDVQPINEAAEAAW